MKTLDEVIEAMERCSIPHYFDCKGCPYEDDDAEVGCRSDDRDADALHYLKTYRENQHAYIENSRKAEEARERYMEEFKNCELAENKYKRLCEETSQNLRNTSQITCPKCHSEFVILPEANNALTWDELKQMENKPIWVEYNFHISNRKFQGWCIIREFRPWRDTEIIITDNGLVLSKNEQVTYWQAYRKERAE